MVELPNIIDIKSRLWDFPLQLILGSGEVFKGEVQNHLAQIFLGSRIQYGYGGVCRIPD